MMDILIKWDLQLNIVVICSDSNIVLVGGFGCFVGIVVIVGMGFLVFGQNSYGLIKWVGGWGYFLGDEGSGYNIVIRGLQAVLKSYDGCEFLIILVIDFIRYLGLKNIEGIIEIIYCCRWDVIWIVVFVFIVLVAVDKEDKVVKKIIQGVVEELSKVIKIVIFILFQVYEIFEVVIIGSVWNSMINFCGQFEDFIVAIVFIV